MKKIRNFLYSLYAMILFVALMLIAVLFVLAASFFGRDKGGDMVYFICRQWAAIWFFLIGIRQENIYPFPYDAKRQYVFTANHQSYLDIPTLLLAIRQKMRVLGKASLAKVPVFGFIYSMAAILVERSSAENRSQSIKLMIATLKKGRSIFIFPEGTFNESDEPLKAFYDGAFRIAIETQTNIKPVIFPDTAQRMHWSSIFAMSPGRNRAVFLEEINVQGLCMKDVKMLKEKVYAAMESALLQYKNQVRKVTR